MEPKSHFSFLKKLFGYSLICIACSILYTALSGWTISSEKALTPLNHPWHQGCYDSIAFDPEIIETLKQTTLVFVIREQDKPYIDEFEKMLESSWTFTKNTKIIGYDELPAHTGPDYMQCVLHCFLEEWSNGGSDVIWYLSFKYTYEESGESKTMYLARWDLNIDDALRHKMFGAKMAKRVLTFYKEDGIVKNGTPGILALYVKETNKKLHEAQRSSLFETVRNEEALDSLKTETLYVPDYVLKRYKNSGKEKEPHKPEELFKNYPYSCKVLSNDELSEKILKKEVRYVLDYIKETNGYSLRIFDREKGKIFQRFIYREWKISPEQIGSVFPNE